MTTPITSTTCYGTLASAHEQMNKMAKQTRTMWKLRMLPDGDHVLFISDRDGNMQAELRRVDGKYLYRNYQKGLEYLGADNKNREKVKFTEVRDLKEQGTAISKILGANRDTKTLKGMQNTVNDKYK